MAFSVLLQLLVLGTLIRGERKVGLYHCVHSFPSNEDHSRSSVVVIINSVDDGWVGLHLSPCMCSVVNLR